MAIRKVKASGLEAYVPRVAVEWPGPERFFVTDGSLVFVDISGFTALSERLAARGRIGAEELTEAISGCFADLLALAYGEGGSLLKFGGDALLLFFEGGDHAARAVRSAIRMRRRMRTVGKLTTSVGSVRLRMSVGVHSGEISLFRVGDSHEELILTGPGASTTVSMESIAEAGDILVSDATAASIDRSLLGERKGPGTLVRDRALPEHEDSFPPRPPATDDDLLRVVPVALREHLLDGGGDSEHRHVSIAFVHFDGTDELIRERGAAETAEALAALVTDVQRAAATHQVTFLASDIDRDGGKIILVSGVPRTLGDDEGRLLRAVREIADRDRVLPVRIGVNRGHVFAGEVGPRFRRTYTIMGDAVNLAARLMAAATPGQVLVSEGVLSLSRTAFETTTLEPIRVKGKAQPVQPFELGAIKGTQERRASSMLPLIGRDDEVAQLMQALAETMEGWGRVVELTGETGIGKSRLVEEVRARAVGVPSLVVACEQYESATPFFAARALLLRVLGIDDPFALPPDRLVELLRSRAPDSERWMPLIAEVLGVPVADTEQTAALQGAFRRQRTIMAVTELLESSLTDVSIIVFEDVHWIDDASGDLLAHLERTASQRPWMFVLTRRDEPNGFVASDAAVRLTLSVLDEGRATELIDAATEDAPLPPHEVRALVARAGGNPLFLEELARLGIKTSIDSLPGSLEAVMGIQIDALPPSDRRLLRYAAVLGMTVESEILARIVEDATLDDRTLQRRLGSFLLAGGRGRLRFRHRLLRDVAYEGLPFNTRRQLHSRAGDAIESVCGDARLERGEILSLHFMHARRYDKCWIYGHSAGERAQEAFANVEAMQLYERAISAAQRLDDVPVAEIADTWMRLGEVAMYAGAYLRSHAAFRECRKLNRQEPVVFARACHWDSRVAESEGQRQGAMRWIRKGLKALEGRDDEASTAERAKLQVALAYSYQQLGRPKRAIDWSHAAIDDAKATNSRLALADAYMVLDSAYVDLGQPERAVNADHALPLLEELREFGKMGVLLNALGWISYYKGEWPEAVRAWERAQETLERVGNVSDAAVVRCNLAEILLHQGRLDEAEAILRDLIRLWRSIEQPFWMAIATMLLGRVHARRGDLDDALAAFDDAQGVFAGFGADANLADLDALVAELKL
ncbi:MAG: adenylate/guanylate cyclase domain-containing protein, partial [Actinomycetota bacterium]